jgi:hypothetical protein
MTPDMPDFSVPGEAATCESRERPKENGAGFWPRAAYLLLVTTAQYLETSGPGA